MGNILVCDDERSICEMLDIALRRDGHKVETVKSGEDAKRKLESALYDVVVTDLCMPESNGHALAVELLALSDRRKGWHSNYSWLRDIGTEAVRAHPAKYVRGVAGTWEDLTDNVNSMASNLTDQVRGIARVVTAVANGDLKRKLTVEAKGEIAELADTINNMTDTLATFADQVTSVAREVGVEGKLGGQANVPGAAGTWRDLTDNVNGLAANLTNQVRAIAEVSTAVTKGDLTRSITVEAQGEVAKLKDNINEMILNLKDTTQKNTEQDWLKTNLARFTRMLQGQRDMKTVAQMVLSELAPLVNAQQGVFYVNTSDNGQPVMKLLGGYAYSKRKNLANEFHAGEGLVGQCTLERERILVTNVPGNYVHVSSGLGEAAPNNFTRSATLT